jgi:hypothetical protein
METGDEEATAGALEETTGAVTVTGMGMGAVLVGAPEAAVGFLLAKHLEQ